VIPWTPDTLPADHVVTVVMTISGDDIATLKRSQERASGHDDEKQIADILRRLNLVFEDRARKMEKDL
jgi:hypothetical protein